jgi:Alanine-zipper, major outer membrane lipoprotein
VRRASTVIKTSCLIIPLLFTWGCGTMSGSTSGTKTSAASAPDKADQALANSQSALQEARAARASADAALQEARGNRAKLEEILAALKASGGSPAVAQALQTAQQANQTAQEAKALAEQAQESAQKLNTRQDRMFEKAMRK